MRSTEQTRNILIGVDIQNDFISGSLAVSDGEDVVSPINDVARAVRDSGGNVVFTRDWHPSATPHFEKWPVHCVEKTDGAAFHPALAIEENDSIVSKGMGQTDGYSGWEGRTADSVSLETIIAPLSLKERVRVFVGGLATDYCVKATTLAIADHFKDDGRVRTYLLRDAVRAVNLQPGDGDEALQAMLDAQVAAITSEEARTLVEGVAQ